MTDLKMQGDGWADWPGMMQGWLAKLDARKGRTRGIAMAISPLIRRTRNIRVYHENTTTYAMIPAKPNLPFIPRA